MAEVRTSGRMCGTEPVRKEQRRKQDQRATISIRALVLERAVSVVLVKGFLARRSCCGQTEGHRYFGQGAGV